jgi:hypothetical protein
MELSSSEMYIWQQHHGLSSWRQQHSRGVAILLLHSLDFEKAHKWMYWGLIPPTTTYWGLLIVPVEHLSCNLYNKLIYLSDLKLIKKTHEININGILKCNNKRQKIP